MKMQEVVNEVKLELTGEVLELEIEDSTIVQIVNKALRELNRFWDETTMVTIPFASCIDLSAKDKDGKNVFDENVSSIVKIYRTAGVGETTNGTTSVMSDPLYTQQWMMFSNGGTMYNLNDYVMNYASWLTLSKIRNTLSTDLAFEEDRHNKKLYINSAMTSPGYITIKYIPKLKSVEDIQSDY